MFDFIAEVILGFVGYNIGYFFIKLFSGGKYPKEYLESDGDLRIEIFGIIMVILILMIVYLIFF